MLYLFWCATNKLRPEDIVEALKLFCASLDVPDLDLEQQLPTSMRSTRDLASLSLFGISSLPTVTFADAEGEVYVTFQSNWPNILKWMCYFGYEVIASDPVAVSPSTSTFSKDDLPRFQILNFLNGLIQRISRHSSCTTLYENAIFRGGLLDLIVIKLL